MREQGEGDAIVEPWGLPDAWAYSAMGVALALLVYILRRHERELADPNAEVHPWSVALCALVWGIVVVAASHTVACRERTERDEGHPVGLLPHLIVLLLFMGVATWDAHADARRSGRATRPGEPVAACAAGVLALSVALAGAWLAAWDRLYWLCLAVGLVLFAAGGAFAWQTYGARSAVRAAQRRARLPIGRIESLYARGRYSDAVRYGECLKPEKRDTPVLCRLAACYLQTRRMRDARRLAAELLTREDLTPEWREWLEPLARDLGHARRG